MSQAQQEAPAKPRKQKNWAQIYGSCKCGKLSDGLSAKPCKGCNTVSKLRECPFCGTKRGKK